MASVVARWRGGRRWVRTWRERWKASPMYGDGLLMLLLAPLTLFATVSIFEAPGLPPQWVAVLMGLAMTLPLLWRRSSPEAAAAVVAAAHVVQVATVSTPIPANITAPIMFYAVVRHGRHHQEKYWLALMVLGALAGAVRWSWYVSPYAAMSAFWQITTQSVGYGLANLSVVAAAWFMAQWARQRQLTLDSLRQRAEALEREHAKAVALVGEEERNRIAREMHDIVAHSLSVIVVQADGAGYLAQHGELGDPQARLEQVTKAIATIRETAGSALGETRRLVGVLRHEGESPELAPAATLDQIAELVHQLGSTGIPAHFERTGHPSSQPALASSAQMALYRVAQESLTNVMKHAGPGASVTVRLHEDADGATLHVADTGRGATPTDGAGHGVIGMRERMAAWGGTLEARPRAGGGFEVLAHLPAATPTTNQEL